MIDSKPSIFNSSMTKEEMKEQIAEYNKKQQDKGILFFLLHKTLIYSFISQECAIFLKYLPI